MQESPASNATSKWWPRKTVAEAPSAAAWNNCKSRVKYGQNQLLSRMLPKCACLISMNWLQGCCIPERCLPLCWILPNLGYQTKNARPNLRREVEPLFGMMMMMMMMMMIIIIIIIIIMNNNSNSNSNSSNSYNSYNIYSHSAVAQRANHNQTTRTKTTTTTTTMNKMKYKYE